MFGDTARYRGACGPRWDVIVIGGGITGAGVLLEVRAARQERAAAGAEGFRLGNVEPLVEDGAWRLALYRAGRFPPDARCAAGTGAHASRIAWLVIRQTYAFLVRQGEFPGRWPLTAVLWLYDFPGQASGIAAGSAARICLSACPASRRIALAAR